MRRNAVFLATLAAIAMGAPSAQAFSVGHAHGAVVGGHIVYGIEACGLKHARVGIGLLVESQEAAWTTQSVWERRWSPRTQRYSCTEWTVEVPDIWLTSDWVASQLFVLDYTHRQKRQAPPFTVYKESFSATPSEPQEPRAPFDPADYPVTCADGWTSPSGGDQGACSHHGGVLG